LRFPRLMLRRTGPSLLHKSFLVIVSLYLPGRTAKNSKKRAKKGEKREKTKISKSACGYCQDHLAANNIFDEGTYKVN
jgi:hypothetical protein